MAIKAYSYIRFSTPEQFKGDSLRRQTARARTWATERGVELDDSLDLQARGVSAFRGRNMAEGSALAEFLALAEAGEVEAGSYLLIENLDRFSRQTSRKAIRALEEIVEAGVTVVDLSDGREYTVKVLDEDPMALIGLVIGFQRAHEESRRKAQLVRASWEGRRKKASTSPITSICPGWLRFDKNTGRFVRVSDRVRVVKRIFREYLKGTGKHAIAEALNREGVPVFGTAKYWHRSYVAKILSNPAVIGTLVPGTSDHIDGKRVVTSLDPIPGYYPAVVSEETFNQVKALQKGGGSPRRGKHASAEVSNIFGNLGKCARCDGAVVRVNKGGTNGKQWTYLVCSRAKTGAGCTYTAVRYDAAEEAFLGELPEVIADAPAGDSGQAIDRELRQVAAQLSVLEGLHDEVFGRIRRRPSPTASRHLRELETERDLLLARRTELEELRDTSAGPLVNRRLDTLLDLGTAQPLDRTRLNAIMRQVFSAIIVDPDAFVLVGEYRHGGQTHPINFRYSFAPDT